MNIETELAALRRTAPDTVEAAVSLGAGMIEGYSRYKSPVGMVEVTFNPHGVTSVDLDTDDARTRFVERFGRNLIEAEPPQAWGRRIPEALERGTPGKLPIDLSSSTPFRRSVLLAAARIPHGEVRPYAWLAIRVGRPGATRAVGSAMSTNPVPLIIPCHRVVRSDGHLGAYSLGDPENKRTLLATEGLSLERLERLATRGVRYIGSRATKVFCLPSCGDGRHIADRHLVEFHSLSEVEKAGYRPCTDCIPVG